MAVGSYCRKKNVFMPLPMRFTSLPTPDTVSPHPASAKHADTARIKRSDIFIYTLPNLSDKSARVYGAVARAYFKVKVRLHKLVVGIAGLTHTAYQFAAPYPLT
jgi:hypothetical protein